MLDIEPKGPPFAGSAVICFIDSPTGPPRDRTHAGTERVVLFVDFNCIHYIVLRLFTIPVSSSIVRAVFPENLCGRLFPEMAYGQPAFRVSTLRLERQIGQAVRAHARRRSYNSSAHVTQLPPFAQWSLVWLIGLLLLGGRGRERCWQGCSLVGMGFGGLLFHCLATPRLRKEGVRLRWNPPKLR